MAKDRMRYDLMLEDALRGVARRALERVRDEGLPGEHHFYLTFRTDDVRTGVSDTLRARYPQDITIVIQHQFWDLEIGDQGFAVTLSFSGMPERLEVPWGALTGFNDPSVQFGLQFEYRASKSGGPVVPLATDAAPVPLAAETEVPNGAEAEDPTEAEGEKIVTLDSFRKK